MATSYQPVQVKKISELPDFISYYSAYSDKIDLNNAYFAIGYPSNDPSIPHNYKISISQLTQVIANISTACHCYWNNGQAYTEGKGTYIGDISYVWNNIEPYAIKFWTGNPEDIIEGTTYTYNIS